MHTGNNNNKFSYEMNGKVLDKVLVEKDLGIMISSDVKSSQQCVVACNKASVVQLVEYRTRNQEIAGSTHTRSTASNLEQVANLLCAQTNSASYPHRDGK